MFEAPGTRHAGSVIAFLLATALVAAAEPAAPTPARAQPAAGTTPALTVFPAQISLDGPRDEQRLGVLDSAGGRVRDRSREAKFQSSDTAVATVDNQGIVRPIRDGQRRSR